MIAIIILLFLALIIYFVIITIIIQKGKVRKPQVTITPPQDNNFDDFTPVQNPLPSSPPIHTNRYLNHIAQLLLDQKSEVLKLIKFIDSLEEAADRNFILDYFKFHDRQLYDTVFSLLGIDTTDIENFKSEVIDTPDMGVYQSDNHTISLEEHLALGGLPLSIFEEEMKFNGITSFSEYVDQLTDIYVARMLSVAEQQHIDEVSQKIFSPTSNQFTSSPKLPVKTIFEQGKTIAAEIEKEIEIQNNQTNV